MTARSTATLVGFTAVLMWSILALLSAAAGPLPPFQLTAMAFTIGSLLGLATWFGRPSAAAALHQRWQVWLLGVAGLFGYHLVYFTAMRNAPAIEVSLIAYLWPLLLVVFSAFLPGERLKAHHVIGVALGLLGAFVVISKGQGFGFEGGFRLGHLLALGCAMIWAGYSTLSRRLGNVPTDAVVGFCMATAVLSALCHLAFETTVWPASAGAWLAVLGLGLLPVGAAFYTWDYGVKHGDIMVLGASSYVSPVLSTIVLVLAGYAAASWSVLVACLLITAGAVIAAKDMLFPRR
ncbi:MAG: EamA family transporter [Hyphomicrobiales bacterium]